MTSPVCPACRAPLGLDAHECGRCGLAVRPMCSNCGEALEVGRHACPNCWELIDEHPQELEVQQQEHAAAEALAAQHASSPEPVTPAGPAPAEEHEATLTMKAPVATRARVSAEAPDELIPLSAVRVGQETTRRRRGPRGGEGFRTGRLIGAGLAGGVLVAVGLVALEAVAPLLRGKQSGTVRLVERSFASTGFAINAPADWDVSREPDGTRNAVTFTATGENNDTASKRGLRVVSHELTFDNARTEAGRRVPDSANTSYDEIRIVDGVRVDDRRAFRHLFTNGEEYREEWWIEREAGTFKIEFWSDVGDRETAAPLNVRIARTLRVL